MVGATDLLQGAGNSVLSGLFGYAAAIVTFSARFRLADERLERLKAEIIAAREHDKQMLALSLDELRRTFEAERERIEAWSKRIERRQGVTLELIASMAAKQGLTHRALGVDAMAKLLAEGIDDAESLV